MANHWVMHKKQLAQLLVAHIVLLISVIADVIISFFMLEWLILLRNIHSSLPLPPKKTTRHYLFFLIFFWGHIWLCFCCVFILCKYLLVCYQSAMVRVEGDRQQCFVLLFYPITVPLITVYIFVFSIYAVLMEVHTYLSDCIN